MKYGIRTPSLKKSLKSRTTGKIKRAVKKTYNPTYGLKGTGYVKNPKKAVYNNIYHKTTTSIINEPKANTTKIEQTNIETKQANNVSIIFLLCLFFGWLGIHKFYEKKYLLGLIYLLTFGLFGVGWAFDTIVLFFELIYQSNN